MNISINPCKACLNKFSSGKCNINNINHCCYETLAAFKGTDSVNDIRGSPEAVNCVNCVTNAIKYLGKNPDDLQLAPPPLWNRAPHYFPSLLSETKDPSQAFNQCIEKCKDNHLPFECKNNCFVDADAVELKEGYDKEKEKEKEKESPTYQDYAKDKPIPFYLSFALFTILLSIVLVIFIKTLYSNKV